MRVRTGTQNKVFAYVFWFHFMSFPLFSLAAPALRRSSAQASNLLRGFSLRLLGGGACAYRRFGAAAELDDGITYYEEI